MKTRAILIIGLLGWTLFIFSVMSTTLGQASRDCTVRFAAYGNSGLVNRPLMAGELQLTFLPDGTIRGQVFSGDEVTEAGEPRQLADVVGQVNGYAINLVFHHTIIAPDNTVLVISPDMGLFAVGTGSQPIKDCEGLWAGSFVRPQNHTTGEWFAEA